MTGAPIQFVLGNQSKTCYSPFGTGGKTSFSGDVFPSLRIFQSTSCILMAGALLLLPGAGLLVDFNGVVENKIQWGDGG